MDCFFFQGKIKAKFNNSKFNKNTDFKSWKFLKNEPNDK